MLYNQFLSLTDSVGHIIVETFSFLFNILFLPTIEFLRMYDNPFTEFLYNLMTFTNLDILLNEISLGGFLIGTGLFIILCIKFISTFIVPL